MEEVEHIDTKSKMDDYPTYICSILRYCSYEKLHKSYAGLVKTLHVIHCTKKLKIVYYPRLYKNIHYSLDKYSEVSILMSKYHNLDIHVKEYFHDQDYIDITHGECIVINQIENEDEILKYTNFLSLMKNMNAQPRCKKKTMQVLRYRSEW